MFLFYTTNIGHIMLISFHQHPLAPGDTSKKYVVDDSSEATTSWLQLVEKWWYNVDVDSCWTLLVDLGLFWFMLGEMS